MTVSLLDRCVYGHSDVDRLLVLPPGTARRWSDVPRPWSIHRLRPAAVRLRAEFSRYPLAHARPFLDVDGRELVRHVQQEVGITGHEMLAEAAPPPRHCSSPGSLLITHLREFRRNQTTQSARPTG
ncbi:MAG: hypothetical protein ACT4NY_17955 [Pseudonocardiales bacterium]